MWGKGEDASYGQDGRWGEGWGEGGGNHREVMDDQGSQAIGSQPVWIPHPPPVQVQVWEARSKSNLPWEIRNTKYLPRSSDRDQIILRQLRLTFRTHGYSG